jgi:hypothetical protein
VRTKRAIWITLLCAALVGALCFPYPAFANSVIVTFDAGGWGDFTIVHGTLGAYGNPNQGLYGGSAAGNCNSFPASYTVNRVDFVLNVVYTITGFAYDHKESGGGSTGGVVILYDSSDTVLATYTPSYTGSSSWHTYSNSSINVAGVKKVSIQNSACGGAGYQVYLDNASITATDTINPTNTPTATPTATLNPSIDGWNKPIRAADVRIADTSYHGVQNPFGGVGLLPWSGATHNEETAFGFSELAYAPVFAVRDGTIDSVDLLTNTSGNSCTNASAAAPYCYAVIYGDNTYYLVKYEDTYIVTESIDGGRKIRYFLQGVQVTVGDAVTAGCQIGKSVPMKGFGESEWPIGAVLLQGIEPDGISSFDITQKLVNPPIGNRCASTRGAACTLTQNPDFQISEGGWTVSPGHPDMLSVVPYIVPDGGIIFPMSVQQTLNLDSQAQYKISLQYAVQPGATNQTFTVALGTTVHTITSSANLSGALIEKTFDAATYIPDQASGLYTLQITALTGQADQTDLRFICVSDANDQVVAPGGGCIVLDPMFSQTWSSSPWAVGGDPAALVPGGMAVVYDGSTLSQSITLNPAEGGGNINYDLQVTYRRQGVASTGKSIALDWSFGSQSGSLTAATDQVWRDYIDTFGIATNSVTATLTLTGSGSDAQQTAQISKVCIAPHDGGTAPGYRPPPPFEAGCRFCVYSPTGDVATDLGELQQWLGCQFYQLWECQAKILLRYIWQTLVNILTLLGFFRLWLSATIINLTSWGNGNLLIFIRWLEGQISNAVSNLVLAIFNWHDSAGGSPTNIWDFLIAVLGALVEIIKAIISLVGSIVQLIISGVIGFLVNGIGGFLGMIQSIINGIAYSSSQVQVDWLPNCADPQSALFVICAASAGIEQELSLTPIPVLVPVILGAGAFGLIWWAINRFIRAVSGDGE